MVAGPGFLPAPPPDQQPNAREITGITADRPPVSRPGQIVPLTVRTAFGMIALRWRTTPATLRG